MIDLSEHVRTESARFVDAISTAIARSASDEVLATKVPSCPDWSVADLIWHLSEVQHFWRYILGESGREPETYDRPERPVDDQLLGFLEQCSSGLIAGLDRPDDEPCWSWSPKGGTVAWVRRRQAQEAMIHRVDAELAVGEPTPLDNELAGDGVDEMLRVMLDIGELRGWASFEPEPQNIVLDTGDRWWSVRLGRFKGTNPDSHEPVNLPALSVTDAGVGNGLGAVEDYDTHVTGSAADLNRWLWGRAEATTLEITGDPDAVNRLRATAADAT